MKITFDAIPSEGLSLTVDDDAWFPQDEYELRGPLAVHVALLRSNERVTMRGSIACSFDITCDRCLAPYTSKVESDFSIFFDLIDSDSAVLSESEHYLTAQDLDVVELEQPVIDVFSALLQQFYLLLPAKSICGADCKGLCVHCGENLNLGRCSCSGKDVETPFAILAKLKDN